MCESAYNDNKSLNDLVEIVAEKTTSVDNAEVLIRWIKGFPESVYGLCSKRSDSLYWILINADKSEEQQEETLHHEILHIKRSDFDSDRPVQELEAEVHQQIEEWKQQKRRGA